MNCHDTLSGMLQRFLSEQRHAFTIAKIAIVFQTVATTIIIVLLFISTTSATTTHTLLSKALVADILFVICHLIYRLLYTGPRSILKKEDTNILAIHSILSLLALIITTAIILNDISYTNHALMFAVIMIWIVSLIFGILFFLKKYKKLYSVD